MKRILFLIGLFLVLNGSAFAVTDVNETAGDAISGSVSVASHTYTDMSSNTVTNAFAYNLCNEDSTNQVRCGYAITVSTIAASQYLGFWVKPQECEYRAVSYGIKIYCKAIGTAAIAVTREVFGKPD